MPEQSSTSTSTSTLDVTNSYTIREAATMCDVSVDTIKRRLQDDRFPGAEQIKGRTGNEWRIPSSELAAVATAEGWKLDLATALPEQAPQQDAQALQDLVDRAVAEAAGRAEAEAKLEHAQGDIDRLTKSIERAESDVEHWRTEHGQVERDLVDAKARAAELRIQLEKAEKLNTEVAQDRDSMGDKYHELEKESAESLSALSADLETAKAESESLVGERDELAAKTAALESSMGWWSRRKYDKKS